MNDDRLKWWEDIPLGLALVAQSYVVGLWYYASINGATPAIDMAVAIGAGLALDLIVVTTVMGRRQGRSSGWSWATSLGAFLCSSLIALDRYGWEYRSLLHVAFPLVVFLYSQHLATPRKTPLEALPKRLVAPKETDPVASSAAIVSSVPVVSPLAERLNGHYACPHCKRSLTSKQAVGAAVKNGYCLGCKAERLAEVAK